MNGQRAAHGREHIDYWGKSPDIFSKNNCFATKRECTHNITTKTITGVQSRAGAIVNAAEEGGWGTIVAGRRGLSYVSEFFMGSVSNKLVHEGRMHTVWIVT